MAFASAAFILFLTVSALLYYNVPKRGQWIFLLLISILFYSLSGIFSLIILALAVLLSWRFACAMGKRQRKAHEYIEANRLSMDKDERKVYKAKVKSGCFRILVLSLVTIIGILLADKLFETYIISAISHNIPENVLSVLNKINKPAAGASVGIRFLSVMGISYFVFMAAGYLIDVYCEKIHPQESLFRYALFISFFPHTIQGPISRYGELEEQLLAPRKAEWDNISGGIVRILWGFFKKLVIADTVAPAIGKLTGGDEYTGAYVVLTLVLYTAQIYGDFTGGIDITIGTARIFGITLKENFNHPFSSRSLKEYWNRWHITMGEWFTDYIFYPLSVCRPMQKLSKKSREKLGNGLGKRVPVYIATAVTWFATGVWHGTKWNFIVWGMLNCVIILFSQELEPVYRKLRARFPRYISSGFHSCAGAVRTFFIVGALRLFDIYADVPTTFSRIGTIFYTFNIADVIGNLTGFGLSVANILTVAVGTAVVIAVTCITKKTDLIKSVTSRPAVFASVCSVLCAVVLIFGAYGMGYDASQFIYGGAKFK